MLITTVFQSLLLDVQERYYSCKFDWPVKVASHLSQARHMFGSLFIFVAGFFELLEVSDTAKQSFVYPRRSLNTRRLFFIPFLMASTRQLNLLRA